MKVRSLVIIVAFGFGATGTAVAHSNASEPGAPHAHADSEPAADRDAAPDIWLSGPAEAALLQRSLLARGGRGHRSPSVGRRGHRSAFGSHGSRSRSFSHRGHRHGARFHTSSQARRYQQRPRPNPVVQGPGFWNSPPSDVHQSPSGIMRRNALGVPSRPSWVHDPLRRPASMLPQALAPPPRVNAGRPVVDWDEAYAEIDAEIERLESGAPEPKSRP